MARPRKIGLEYFSLDIDILSDIKIKKLIRRKGGGRALSVYIALLCQIYKKGYYFDYDEDTSFLLSVDLDEEESYVEEIIQYCIEIALFDRVIYEAHSVLTSRSIQERFMYVCKTTQRKVSIVNYNLLDNKDINKEQTRVNKDETPINNEETPNKQDKNCGKTRKPRNKKDENPDKLPENALKEKEKKSKIKNLNGLNPTTTSSTTPARDENDLVVESKGEADIHSEVEQLKNDREWCHSTALYLCIPPNTLLQTLDRFEQSCQIRGKTAHISLQDCKKHFLDWYSKETHLPNSPQHRSPLPQRRAQAVQESLTEKDFSVGFE